MHSVALLTPTYRNDIDRFELLCESIDRYVTGFDRHYVIVNDDDFHLFQRFASLRRLVIKASKFLPVWLVPAPRFLARNGRRVWVSALSMPVHGWHVQQLVKIAGSLAAREDRVCIVDSDNTFFRNFDVRAYAGGETTPLYVDRDAIKMEMPNHTVWTKNAFKLLGLGEPTYPSDDYVGNVIAWDRGALKAMTEHIHRITGVDWRLALCRSRGFSEYLLYGNFVANAPHWRERHQVVEDSLACAYWEETSVNASWLKAMVANADPHKVALCIQSYSHTAVLDIRTAMHGAVAA